jgi:uncharacterized RDD family membrane protein YckC
VIGAEQIPPNDDVAEGAGSSSALGEPGVSWRGDGALSAGRAQLRALDPDQETFLPAVGEQSGYPLARFQRRWMGFILDELIILALVSVIWVALDSFASSSSEVVAGQTALAATLLRVGYGLIFNPRGWSPGKRWMGLRIVRLNGEAPGTRYGMVRTAAAVISHDLVFLGYLWAALDPKMQTWHDKLAGTYVVRVDEVDYHDVLAEAQRLGWKRRER